MRRTSGEVLADIKARYGSRYKFDETTFKNTKERMRVICPEHGEFWKTPYELLGGYACRRCGKKPLVTLESFLSKAKSIHGDKYDYSKVQEVNGINHRVTIICHQHGEFTQIAYSHLNGKGCRLCGIEKGRRMRIKTFDSIKAKVEAVHGRKYKLDESTYSGCEKKMRVICPVHGEFWQTTGSLMKGFGCPHCSKRPPLTLESFLQRARKKHGNKYDYSKVKEIKGCWYPVTVICPKHGEFTKNALNYLRGRGCLQCYFEDRKAAKLKASKKQPAR